MKKWIVVIMGVILLLLGCLVVMQLQKEATLAENRRHIFCEKLIKGMSQREVLRVLNEFGEFEYGTGGWGKSYSEIVGNYADISITGQTTIYIMFTYGKYTNAYMERHFSDAPEMICSH